MALQRTIDALNYLISVAAEHGLAALRHKENPMMLSEPTAYAVLRAAIQQEARRELLADLAKGMAIAYQGAVESAKEARANGNRRELWQATGMAAGFMVASMALLSRGAPDEPDRPAIRELYEFTLREAANA
jgi:hypothetical protein